MWIEVGVGARRADVHALPAGELSDDRVAVCPHERGRAGDESEHARSSAAITSGGSACAHAARLVRRLSRRMATIKVERRDNARGAHPEGCLIQGGKLSSGPLHAEDLYGRGHRTRGISG